MTEAHVSRTRKLESYGNGEIRLIWILSIQVLAGRTELQSAVRPLFPKLLNSQINRTGSFAQLFLAWTYSLLLSLDWWHEDHENFRTCKSARPCGVHGFQVRWPKFFHRQHGFNLLRSFNHLWPHGDLHSLFVDVFVTQNGSHYDEGAEHFGTTTPNVWLPKKVR